MCAIDNYIDKLIDRQSYKDRYEGRKIYIERMTSPECGILNCCKVGNARRGADESSSTGSKLVTSSKKHFSSQPDTAST